MNRGKMRALGLQVPNSVFARGLATLANSDSVCLRFSAAEVCHDGGLQPRRAMRESHAEMVASQCNISNLRVRAGRRARFQAACFQVGVSIRFGKSFEARIRGRYFHNR
jgi:hypothetical protein